MLTIINILRICFRKIGNALWGSANLAKSGGGREPQFWKSGHRNGHWDTEMGHMWWWIHQFDQLCHVISMSCWFISWVVLVVLHCPHWGSIGICGPDFAALFPPQHPFWEETCRWMLKINVFFSMCFSWLEDTNFMVDGLWVIGSNFF